MTQNIGFQPDPNTQRSDETIANGWFPSLSVAAFADTMGVPSELPNAIVKAALLQAIGQVNQDVDSLRVRHPNAAKLAEVEADTLGDESALVFWYRQAVYNRAKARLVRDQISIGRKPNAESEAKTGVELVNHFDAEASAAIAALFGSSNLRTVLI